ncbi:MAG: galactose-1-phosphate uridylyltransferase [Aquificota bacterium]|nr:MAG: galactose-1-phosphate uridylyltransferase [Aquificota bacterium]
MFEIRYNFLKDTYVIFSSERAKRPHDYKHEPEAEIGIVENCPFEYGNENKTPSEVFAIREKDTKPNTPEWKVRVIPNKYPAVKSDIPFLKEREGIYLKYSGYGYHEILIDTPDHYKQIYNFSVEEIKNAFIAVKERFLFISKDKKIKYIQFFKNYGKEAGSSLFHSHSQIIAIPILPKEVKTQLSQLKNYFEKNKKCYLCEEINFEIKEDKRIIFQNEEFLAYCPYYSIFPFEVRIIPKKHLSRFECINENLLIKLSEVLLFVAKKIYKILNNPAFNLILYTSPFNIKNEDFETFNHWYIEILPRLTTIAGFELGSGFYINTTYPEDAAKFLKQDR